MQENCIFCQIIRGEIPSFNVWEDEDTFAFMDINPVHDGHVLIIPKEHADDVFTVSAAAISAVMRTAREVARSVRAVVQPDGLNLVQCNGAAAAQSVLHFHVHVLPRKENDNLALNWGLQPGDMDHIGTLAKCIRADLEAN
jgi:histidine triad (HIT) family protein